MIQDRRPTPARDLAAAGASARVGGVGANTAESPSHPLAALHGTGAGAATAAPFAHLAEGAARTVSPAAPPLAAPGHVSAPTASPRSIERVVNPQTKQVVYKYTENGKVRWMDESQLDYMNGAGQDVIHTGEQHGFSSYGSLFMSAQASLESGWGKGNWMPETHNLFSMMGGTNPKYKNAHGTLRTYQDNVASTTDYIHQLDGKWGAATKGDDALFRRDSFSPDDANKAFHQKQYYPTAQQRNQGTYAYNADPSSDYGRQIMQRMQYMAGPMLALKEQALASEKDPTRRQELQHEVDRQRADYASINEALHPTARP